MNKTIKYEDLVDMILKRLDENTERRQTSSFITSQKKKDLFLEGVTGIDIGLQMILTDIGYYENMRKGN